MKIEVLEDREQLQAKIIGYIIKTEREKREITASKIASDLGLSRQYISEIEHGNRKISFGTIKNILQYLDIKFEFKFNKQIIDRFYDFLKCYYEKSIEEAKQSLMKIIEENKNCYTFDYPIIVLCEFILSEMNRKRFDLPLDFILYLRKELYTPFLYFKAHEYYVNKDYHGSLEFLEQAMRYIRHLNISIKFIAVIYYLKALVLDDMCNYIEAIKYNQLAKKEFIKDYNVEYVLYCTLHQANAYSNLGVFSESMKLYEEILEKSNMLEDKKIIKMVKYNVCMLNFLNNGYSEILTFFKKHMINDKEPYMGEEYLSFNEDIKIILSKTYYELGDKKRSISYFKRIKVENIEDQFMKNFINIHRYRLEDDMKSYEKALHKCFDEISENDIIHTKILILKHMMKYYEDVKDYEKAYTYAQILLNVSEQIKK